MALVYLAVGAAWILGSDWAADQLFGDRAQASRFQTIKGLCFVGITAGLVYWLARRSETRLRERNRIARLHAASRISSTVLAAIGEAVLVIDADGHTILACNPAAERMFGHARHGLRGRDVGMLLADAADLALVSRVPEQPLAATGDARTPIQLRHRDGHLLAGEVTVRAIVESGWPAGSVVSMIVDVSERVRAELALQAQEAKYRRLAESTPDLIWTMNRDLVIQYANPASRAILGMDPEEVVGTRMARYLLPSEYPSLSRLFRERAALPADEDGGLLVETRLLHRDGSVVPVEVHGTVLRDVAGQPVGVQGTIRDIRQRLESAAKLRVVIDRLDSLRRVDQSISAMLPLTLLSQRVASEACTALDIDAAAVLHLVEPEHRLMPLATSGFQTSLSDGVSMRLDEGLIGRSAREGRALSVADVQDPASGFLRGDIAAAEGLRGFASAPMIVQGRVVGALAVFRRRVGALQPDELEFLELLAGQAAIGSQHVENVRRLATANEGLLSAYDANIEGWSRALDYRDHETQGHSARVTAIAVALARAAGIEGDELRFIRWGALLHDIGKMGVPDHILRKPGPLTEEERDVIRTHPTIARDLLKPIRFLERALPIPVFHHERWDGSGYPHGLAGEDIPLAARLFAVVDVFDAMRTTRPYRVGWPEARVLEHLDELAGSGLDPDLVALFRQVMPSIPECRSLAYAPDDGPAAP
ncbi:MAG: PAS domain S-box protein [Gemmatimonadetes bacterium]|nr:PAS domain S-box protein [Gemmatimonadota bacterium]MCB9519022.1 PAS domain S-box protein [Gemmatimonadales bacterium]